ncbi:MAG: hypothetical protein M1827_001011 [Pycnora praestabilis]|nr:MAG: hypothetical protein M1827_001011 [Pycnora praestabilis]
MLLNPMTGLWEPSQDLPTPQSTRPVSSHARNRCVAPPGSTSPLLSPSLPRSVSPLEATPSFLYQPPITMNETRSLSPTNLEGYQVIQTPLAFVEDKRQSASWVTRIQSGFDTISSYVPRWIRNSVYVALAGVDTTGVTFLVRVEHTPISSRASGLKNYTVILNHQLRLNLATQGIRAFIWNTTTTTLRALIGGWCRVVDRALLRLHQEDVTHVEAASESYELEDVKLAWVPDFKVDSLPEATDPKCGSRLRETVNYIPPALVHHRGRRCSNGCSKLALPDPHELAVDITRSSIERIEIHKRRRMLLATNVLLQDTLGSKANISSPRKRSPSLKTYGPSS